MISSFIALMGLRFLSWTIIGILITLPILVLYYLFIKCARLYCKVKKELKHVLKNAIACLSREQKKKSTMKQDAVLDKKQLALSWQDYKRIFYISTVICLILKFAWGGDFLSFAILQPFAWMLAFVIFFLPTILLLRIRVTRKLKTMVQQLQEET